MAASAPSQSHLARSLLRLGEQSWSGTLRLAGRTLEALEGRIVRVHPAAGERGLRAFLQAADRLPPEAPSELDETDLLDWLDRTGRWQAVQDALNALWVERLAWALERALRRDEAPLLDPTKHPPRPHRWPSAPALFEAVLDALATLATRGPAEQVGLLASHHRLIWLPGVPSDRAARWASLVPDALHDLGQWLSTEPAGASRIAALLIGGLGRLEATEASRLHSSASTTLRIRPLPLDRWLPHEPETSSGDDPLAPLERELREAERREDPSPALARRWLELARGWRRHYDAPVEEARCARQAAALAAEDPLVQRAAAEACLRAARPDLARRYAELAVALVAASPTHLEDDAHARHLAAWFTRFAPRLDQDVDISKARRLALAEGAEDVLLDEVYTRLRTGREQHATLLAHQAARALPPTASHRRTALAIWACTTSPEAPDVRFETAALLIETGRVHAAIALLLEAAALSSDPARARQFRVRAAEMAERAERPDLAATALLEAFEAEPDLEVLHEALVVDLEAIGDPAYHALILEEVASSGGERRFEWALAAALRHLELGEAEAAAEMAGRALLERPDDSSALEALSTACARCRDEPLEADWLERIVRAWSGRDPQRVVAVLERLAHLCSERLQSPPRALWAWSRLESLLGTPAVREAAASWRERARTRRQALALAERELEGQRTAAPERVAEARRTLASLLRDWPDDRRRAAALYQEVLAQDPQDEVAHASLERILRALGEESARTAALEVWMRHAAPGARRVRIAERLASLYAWEGRWEACARALLEACEHAPPSRSLALRLERAARRLGDPALLRDALSLQLRTSTEKAWIVRARAALAATLESLDRGQEAAEEALQALQAAPTHAEAAAVLLRQLHELSPQRLQRGVEALCEALGESAPLWRRAAQTAEQHGLHALAAEWFLEAARLPPPDPALAITALRHAVETARPDLVRRAASRLMDVAHLSPHKAAACYATVLERLARAGSAELAVTIAIEALDGLACIPAEVATRCLDVAETCDDPRLRHMALERCIARTRGKRRLSLLKALAAVHRETNQTYAEMRAWLRVLHEHPEDDGALKRLTHLLEHCADYERLVEVLALRAVRTEDEEERRGLLARRAAVLALGLNRSQESLRQLEHLYLHAPASERHDMALRIGATLLYWRLPERAVDWLLRCAEELQEHAPDEARRLYREAVALAEEDAGRPRLALRAAKEALQRFSADACFLDAFDRLAGRLEDEEEVNAFYARRLAEALGRHGRRAARYRWGRWMQHHGRLERAARLFREALEEAPSEGVVLEALLRCADAADVWQDAVAGLRLVAEATRDPNTARRLAERTASILDERLGEPLSALKELLAVAERTGTTASLRERIGVLLERLASMGGEVQALRERARPLLEEERPTLVLDSPPEELEPSASPSAHAPPAMGADPPPDGDVPLDVPPEVEPEAPSHHDLAIRWHATPTSDREGGASALDALLEQARRTPLSAPSLRALLQAAERHGAEAIAWACRLVLRAAETHAVPTPPPSEPFTLGLPLRLAHADTPATHWELLAAAWRCTRSLLLKPLSTWNVLGTERMPLFARRPLARAYVQLLSDTMGREVDVYLHASGDAPLRLLPTRPVSLLVAPDLEERPEAELWALLGAGLFWARPEHLFVSTATPREARERLDALYAAFGPTNERPSDPRIATLVTRFWDTIPPRDQDHLRKLFPPQAALPEPNDILASVRRAGLRAGLLASGDLAATLRAFEALDITERERCELAAFLLSDPVLGALAEALPARDTRIAPPPR